MFSYFFLGNNWISTTVLFAADYLQWNTCSSDNSQCQTIYDEKKCGTLGGVCRPYIDAYYTEVTICTIAGIFWIIWKRRTLMSLQNLASSEWQIRNRRRSQLSEDEDNPSSVLIA